MMIYFDAVFLKSAGVAEAVVTRESATFISFKRLSASRVSIGLQPLHCSNYYLYSLHSSSALLTPRRINTHVQIVNLM